MARGAIGKQNVTQKIAEIFGADYIGEYDKKLYVWTQENGERIQIAISLTCPKNFVGDTNSGGDLNFDTETPIASAPTAEITQEERKTVEDLMARLGL